MEWLNGKKTLIGSVLLSLIGLVWSLDQLIPGEWLTEQQYIAAGTMVAGLTGASMRLAIGKSESAASK